MGNKIKRIAQVQMLNLKFFEFPDIHREHQFKFFHCILKAHLLPSSFLAKPPENLEGITHKVCLCIYVEPGSVNVPQKWQLTVPHCSTVATLSNDLQGTYPTNGNIGTNDKFLFVDGSSFEQLQHVSWRTMNDSWRVLFISKHLKIHKLEGPS